MKKWAMAIFGLIIGILCLAVGIASALETTYFMNNGKTAQAVIQSIHIEGFDEYTTYTIWVEYTVDGVAYSNELQGAFSSDMEVGQSVPIRYLSENPNKIYHDGENKFLMSWIWGAFGLASTVSAIIVIIIKKGG